MRFLLLSLSILWWLNYVLGHCYGLLSDLWASLHHLRVMLPPEDKLLRNQTGLIYCELLPLPTTKDRLDPWFPWNTTGISKRQAELVLFHGYVPSHNAKGNDWGVMLGNVACGLFIRTVSVRLTPIFTNWTRTCRGALHFLRKSAEMNWSRVSLRREIFDYEIHDFLEM